MKQKALTIIAILMFMPMWIFGQDYKDLWKEVRAAESKDLPQTVIRHLTRIEEKAQKEQAYYQLLKAYPLSCQATGGYRPGLARPCRGATASTGAAGERRCIEGGLCHHPLSHLSG